MRDIRAGRWLVGVDGSEPSLLALEWALSNATAGTEVAAAVAWLPPVMDRPTYELVHPGPETEAAEDRLRRHTERAIEGLSMPRARGMEVVVLRGGTAEALLDAAEESSLLIVGSRGIGGFDRLLLGSVSAQCAAHAIVPTVVVPADAPTSRVSSIAVGFDGSPNSIDALLAAMAFAEPDCPVVALGADVTSASLTGYPETVDHIRREHDRTHAEAFDLAIERSGDPAPTVERRFEAGDPTTVLAELSEQHDLLVVGARGHGPIASAVLGSVSSRLLHEVSVPIMVVPREPAS